MEGRRVTGRHDGVMLHTAINFQGPFEVKVYPKEQRKEEEEEMGACLVDNIRD